MHKHLLPHLLAFFFCLLLCICPASIPTGLVFEGDPTASRNTDNHQRSPPSVSLVGWTSGQPADKVSRSLIYFLELGLKWAKSIHARTSQVLPVGPWLPLGWRRATGASQEQGLFGKPCGNAAAQQSLLHLAAKRSQSSYLTGACFPFILRSWAMKIKKPQTGIIWLPFTLQTLILPIRQ